MHTIAMAVSSYVKLPCCVKKTLSLVAICCVYFLHSFCALFHNDPWAFEGLCVCARTHAHTRSTYVQLIIIYCKQKLLWWGFRDKFINVFKGKSWIVYWFSRGILESSHTGLVYPQVLGLVPATYGLSCEVGFKSFPWLLSQSYLCHCCSGRSGSPRWGAFGNW